MTEKDYSLLRPFDLEAAKGGVKMCDRFNLKQTCTYVAGPDSSGWIVTKNENGNFICSTETNLFMLPICWVEGKPVYPGDVLWQGCPGGDVFERTVKGLSSCGNYLVFEGFGAWATDGTVSVLTWENPCPKPVKRWINVYPDATHDNRETADANAHATRIACIEIELPPLLAK